MMKMMKLSLVTLVLSQENQELAALEKENAVFKQLSEAEGNEPNFDDLDDFEVETVSSSSPPPQSSSTDENSPLDDEIVGTPSSSSVSPDESSAEVKCGNHTASSCAECVRDACADKPADDNQCHISAFCNGDCVWEGAACTDKTATVKNCGQHQAESCELCPPSEVTLKSRFCHGDCKWNDKESSCKDKP